ncbi:MAG: hypothetical protein ACLP9L_03755, partial [Thermoguttaceae bacterium]
NVTFEQTLDSQQNQDWGLAVNDPGVTWFAGNVGTNSPLGYLTTDAAGTTYLGSETVPPPGAVATGLPMVLDTQAQSTGSAIATGGGAGGPGNHNGDVDFKDPVLLYADTTINALAYTGTPAVNPNVTFEQTLDSQQNQDWGLAVNDPGVTWFAGNVGTNSPLGYLTAEGGGTTYLGSETVSPPGAVATGLPMVLDTQAQSSGTVIATGGGAGGPGNHNGDVDFKDPVLLYADTTINALQYSGATVALSVYPNVTFEQTVDSQQNEDWGLAVNDPGVTWFAGNVGNTTALGYLTTDLGVTTPTNPNERTQLGSETVAPPGALASGQAMFIDTQAQAGSTVTPIDPIWGPGGAGSPMNHNGDVDFKDPVLLYADTTINAWAYTGTTPVYPNISFEQTVDSQQNQYWGLTANTAGDVFFDGVVGAAATNGTSNLGYLQTDIDPNVDPSINTTAGPHGTTHFIKKDVAPVAEGLGDVNVDASQPVLNPRLPAGTVAVKIGDKVVFNVTSSALVAPASYQATVVTVANNTSKTSTTDGQQYDWAATLQQNAVLVDTNGGNITFEKTVDRDAAATSSRLSIITTPTPPISGAGAGTQPNGLTNFLGNVGSNSPLDALAVLTGGPFVAPNITTTGDIDVNVRRSYAVANTPNTPPNAPGNDQLTVNPGVTVTSTSGNIYLRATDSLNLLAASGTNPLRSKVSAASGQVTLEIGYFAGELTPTSTATSAFPTGYDISSNAGANLHMGTATIQGQIVTEYQSVVNGKAVQVVGGVNPDTVLVYLDPILNGQGLPQKGLPAAGLEFSAPSYDFPAGEANTLRIEGTSHNDVYCAEEDTSAIYHSTLEGQPYDAKLLYDPATVQKVQFDSIGSVENVTVHVATSTSLSTQFWVNGAANNQSTLKIDATKSTVAQDYAIGDIPANLALIPPNLAATNLFLAPPVATASLAWNSTITPIPSTSPPPNRYVPPTPLPASVQQKFSVNDLALLQYFGGIGGGCVINNTGASNPANATEALMTGYNGPLPPSDVALTTLVGGRGSENMLLGGEGLSQLIGRGTTDYLFANFTISYAGVALGASGTLTGPPTIAITANNYIYDYPTVRGYVLVNDSKYVYTGPSVVLPNDSSDPLLPTQWLSTVFMSSAQILCAATMPPLPLLRRLPNCPNENVFDPPIPSFTLTSPASGTFTAGQTVSIQWTAANVDAGSSISLAYDTTSNWGNPKWIEIGGVSAADGTATYSWNTSGIAPGTYYLAGYLYDAGQPYFFHLGSPITIAAAAVPPSFALSGPTSGTFTAGNTVSIQWTAANVDAGSSVSLAYDTTTNWGNAKWIEIGRVTAANGAATYSWNTSRIAPGTYYLAGYLYDAGHAYFSHLGSAITIAAAAAPSFTLTSPTSGTFTAGQTIQIQWTDANVPSGSTISLAYDTTTNWGKPKWIEIGGVNAANGSGSFSWDTAGLAPGTYFLAGYLYTPSLTAFFSHLTTSFTVT